MPRRRTVRNSPTSLPPSKSEYQWNNRYTGTVFTASNEKVAKKAADQLRRGVPAEKVMRVLNAKDPLALAAQDYATLEVGNPSLNAKQSLLVATGDIE